jgi:soluble lytic murein transglycosylase-like protein
MFAVKNLILLIRALGLLALALVLYWLVYPSIVTNMLQRVTPRAEPARSPAPIDNPTISPATAAAPTSVSALGTAAAPSTVPSARVEPQMRIARPASRSQVAVAKWLGAKYRVSASVIEILVVEADLLAKKYGFSPNLLIAVMAIESNFHPYIQSEAGAQGMMQVMPRIHAKRYEKFGGKTAFLDPIVSLKVGAEILRDFRKLKGGSETEALRFYFGGGATSDAYIDRVRAEQRLLNQVSSGSFVPVN